MADRPLRRVLSSPRQCLQSSSAIEGVSFTPSPRRRRPPPRCYGVTEVSVQRPLVEEIKGGGKTAEAMAGKMSPRTPVQVIGVMSASRLSVNIVGGVGVAYTDRAARSSSIMKRTVDWQSLIRAVCQIYFLYTTK